jgi:hypothetical protein
MTQSAQNSLWYLNAQTGLLNINPAQQSAQNQWGSALGAQGQAAQYNQALMQSLMAQQKQQHHWMINGRTMSFEAWLDELAPGEDNPMRTFLILKYKK